MTNEERQTAALNAIEEHFNGMLRAAGSVDMEPETFIGYLLFCVARFTTVNKLNYAPDAIATVYARSVDVLKAPSEPKLSLIITE